MENLELQKRIKALRVRKGFSQEELALKTGLSLRTIQRIESGESAPRGDSIRRISVALEVSPEEIMDWKVREDKNVVAILNLSQLSFLAFPLLGIIIPLAIWILQKDKIKYVNSVGKSILNFQISWSILFFVFYIIFGLQKVFFLEITPVGIFATILGIIILYAYNLIFILANAIKFNRTNSVTYIPSFKILK